MNVVFLSSSEPKLDDLSTVLADAREMEAEAMDKRNAAGAKYAEAYNAWSEAYQVRRRIEQAIEARDRRRL
jgi:hypothetical protein